MDMNNPDSLLNSLNRSQYEGLKREKRVKDGMLPKLDSCFRAKTLGAQQVLLATASQSLLFAAGKTYQGTLIG